MWKMLNDNFDLKTTITLHELVGTLMTLRYTPETPLKEHLNDFTAK